MANAQIDKQQILKSQQTKKGRPRTIRQQQVYRTAQNLYYVLVQMKKVCPVKYRSVLEQTYNECSQLLVALSVAYMAQAVRIPNLTYAAAHVDAIHTAIGVLRSVGAVSRDDNKKALSLAQSCYQQTMAWRASELVRVSQGNNNIQIEL